MAATEALWVLKNETETEHYDVSVLNDNRVNDTRTARTTRRNDASLLAQRRVQGHNSGLVFFAAHDELNVDFA